MKPWVEEEEFAHAHILEYLLTRDLHSSSKQTFKETVLRARAKEALTPGKWLTAYIVSGDFKVLSLFSCVSNCSVNILVSNSQTLECSSEPRNISGCVQMGYLLPFANSFAHLKIWTFVRVRKVTWNVVPRRICYIT